MTGRTGIQWKSASDGKDLAGTPGLAGDGKGRRRIVPRVSRGGGNGGR